ncbi:MAG: HDOD domain-containing protein [Acidobacteria bacterium]|nr:HDOD domain-containing protein [Acidobacteriota bacterium]
MVPPPDDIVERRVKDILARPDLPAFSHHIQQILSSAHQEDVSIRNITEIVLREYSVTLKLLRVANSPLYNRSGRPILSVAHAASLLGLEAIRDLAAGLMLFEHFRNRSSGVRELMVLSLLSANHAREAALVGGYPKPEEAYLCGMFRNLGEILVSCYLPVEYREYLLERQKNLSEKHASRKALKCSFEELGRAMAAHWGLPDSVTTCMADVQTGGTRIHAGHKDFLKTLVQLSHALTTSVYRAAPEASRAATRQLVEVFAPTIGIKETDLKKILERTVEDAGHTATNLRMPFDALRLGAQINVAMNTAPLPPDDDCEPVPPKEADQLETDIQGGHFVLNDVLMTILDRVHAAGPFARVLFGLVEPEANLIHARLAVGTDSAAVLDRFRLPVSIRGGALGVELLRKRDLFALQSPAPAVNPLNAKYLLVCPVLVDDQVIGCLYADSPHPVETGKALEQQIAGLRDLAARAVAKASSQATGGSRSVEQLTGACKESLLASR